MPLWTNGVVGLDEAVGRFDYSPIGNYYVQIDGSVVSSGAHIDGVVGYAPLPAALPLFLTALAGAGLVARRRVS